ncbi:unnamed protein product [Effrenium voratum]|nr:unnamed protein product [Effrenium voratum]
MTPDITTLPAAEDLTFSLDNLSLTGPSQDLPLQAGEVFTELRLAAASADFDAALQAALCVVQADAQPSVSGCSGRPQGLGFSGNALQLAVADGDLVAQNFAFMQGGVYRLCYSSDGSFSAATSSLVPVPYELRVTGARLDCGFDRCLEEFPWRCLRPQFRGSQNGLPFSVLRDEVLPSDPGDRGFTYPDEPAPAHSCVVRVDAHGGQAALAPCARA